MSTAPFPARVHILLAREAPLGLVIRRGPAKQVCTLSWDRQTDQFAVGQWLKGRIYERRSDLSPDGRHFLYFAMNGQWSAETKGSWSALSRAPYLKALSMWPKGDCWFGGGLFVSNNEYWLNGGDDVGALQLDTRFRRVPTHEGQYSYGGECPGVYYLRLLRDGWTLDSTHLPTQHDRSTVFTKSLGNILLLRKFAHASTNNGPGRGCYYDTHEIINTVTGEVEAHPGWEWAELDGERLVWVEAGCLYAAPISGNGVGPAKLLYDFNPLTFEPIAAPY